jgi:hypothetical protein
MNTTPTAASIRHKERARLIAFLNEEARKLEAELDAGRPFNLKLVKQRRSN